MTKRTLLILAGALVWGCDDGGGGADDDRSLFDGSVRPDAGDVVRPGDEEDGGADAGQVVSRLNSVIPNRGDIAGGTPLLVVGTEFVEGMVVRVGERPCRDLVVENENHIRCSTPPADQVGAVPVTVAWPDASRPAVLPEGFSYFRPVGVEAVRPARAPARGGLEVEIDGRGFIEPTQVRFGDTPSPNVTIQNLNRLVAEVPPGMPGTVDVTVRNVNGEARLEGAFTWYEDLFLEAVEPGWGLATGDEEVVLAGSGLAEDSEVVFGDAEAPAEVVASELDRRRLRVRTPAHAPGVVAVEVTNANGQERLRDAFLYVPAEEGPFEVVGVVPRRVPTTGGATFRVGGNGFTEETRVTLDGEPVGCVFERAQILTCTAPIHAAGPVDVEVTEGEAREVLRDGLRYYDEVEVFEVRPERGAVAGGAVVELVGRGFVPDMTLRFEDGPLEILEVVDDGRLWARTPPGRPGLTSLRAETQDDVSLLAEAFEYFDPATRFGGVWGEPIERSINATVLDAYTGEPVAGATVLVVALEDGARWAGQADEAGQVTVSAIDLAGPVSVTAAHPDYEVNTFERVTTENITAYITPHHFDGGNGGPRDPIPPSRITGTVTGLSELEKPLEEGLVLAAFVETTHTSMFNRASLPWPEPSGVLREDGEFEIFCRPGELAVVVTAGYIRAAALDDYFSGQTGYWQMREELRPIQMGFQRFISVSPGEVAEGVEVHLDTPMSLDVPVTLEHPSGGVPGAPEVYEAWPHIDFGPEGWWALDTAAEGPAPQLQVPYMPEMEGWDPDIELEWIGLARTMSDDWQPYTITFERDRHLHDGVVIGPFVGAARALNPTENGELGPGRVIDWEVFPGVDGMPAPADANIVTITSSRGLPLWTHITPGPVTEYELPALPEDILPGGLIDEGMRLTISPVLIDGRFDFADFSYNDLGQSRRKSYSITSVPFFR